MITLPHNLKRFRVATEGSRKAALFAESAAARVTAPAAGVPPLNRVVYGNVNRVLEIMPVEERRKPQLLRFPACVLERKARRIGKAYRRAHTISGQTCPATGTVELEACETSAPRRVHTTASLRSERPSLTPERNGGNVAALSVPNCPRTAPVGKIPQRRENAQGLSIGINGLPPVVWECPNQWAMSAHKNGPRGLSHSVGAIFVWAKWKKIFSECDISVY